MTATDDVASAALIPVPPVVRVVPVVPVVPSVELVDCKTTLDVVCMVVVVPVLLLPVLLAPVLLLVVLVPVPVVELPGAKLFGWVPPTLAAGAAVWAPPRRKAEKTASPVAAPLIPRTARERNGEADSRSWDCCAGDCWPWGLATVGATARAAGRNLMSFSMGSAAEVGSKLLADWICK